ncbi:MAG: hypothetical protein HYZ57_05140 [Acidobacteria bacterium]|nr:hypothetical protein [Acidobacteriota bacterium]
MFTWICEKCGAEVSTAYKDCPRCAEREQSAAPAVAVPAVAELPPRPIPTAVVRRRGLPGWAIALLVMVGLGALLAALYVWVLPSARRGRQPSAAAAPQAIAMQNAPMPVPSAHPLGKHLEITALRVTEYTVPPLLAYESKDLSTTLKTQLRAYELPDWQFVKADFAVLEPK